MSSLDGALRKGKRAGLELCVASNSYSGSEGATHSVDSRIAIARVRGTARYASAIAGGADVFAVCGGVLRMRTTDSERGPSWYHLGAIQ